MTREDIDRALLNVNVGKPATDAYETDLQVLARIVGEQERRLRVLEPCEMTPNEGAPHAWSPSRTCIWCGVRR